MGGKIWSREEESAFWTVIIPSSNKRLLMAHPGHSSSTQENPRGWSQLAATMQSLMAAGARRRYTPLMLYEHFFQNAVLEIFSPRARPFVQAYIAREKQATGYKPSERYKPSGQLRERRSAKAAVVETPTEAKTPAEETSAEEMPMINGSYLSPELEAEVTKHLKTSPGMPGVSITVDSTSSSMSQRPLPAMSALPDYRPKYYGSLQYSTASQPFGFSYSQNSQNSHFSQASYQTPLQWSFSAAPSTANIGSTHFDSTARLGQLATAAAMQPAVVITTAEPAAAYSATNSTKAEPVPSATSDTSGRDGLFVAQWQGVEE